jgi:hypothetical protein
MIHQTTCVYTPQQNGMSERKNRHLLEMTRTLLFQNNISKIFWSETILTSVYLINRLPSTMLNFKSPFEVLHGRKTRLDHLKVFGCTYFVYKNELDKLDFTSIKAIFLGYSSQKKGYKCYYPQNKRLHISRNVFFLEHEPFFKLIEENYHDHHISNDFILLCVTNQERREVFIENHVQIGDQEREDHESSQGETEKMKMYKKPKKKKYR